MKEIFVEGQTLPEAYHKALVELMENGDVECPTTTSSRRNAA